MKIPYGYNKIEKGSVFEQKEFFRVIEILKIADENIMMILGNKGIVIVKYSPEK